MNLGEELVNALNPKIMFTIPFLNFPVTDSVVVMWIIMAAIILIAYIFTRNLQTVPKGKQNIAEVFVEFVYSLAEGNIGHHGKHFAPYLGTVLIFLIAANMISIFNIIPNWEQLYDITRWKIFEQLPLFALRPPTKDVSVTASMAIMSIILVLFAGIRFKGVGGWLKSFVEPVPVVLPFKILDYFIRPLSLCFRLFGNIMGAFIVMELLYAAISLVFPAFVSIYFDLFDGILQAYIFVFLTSLYISEAVE